MSEQVEPIRKASLSSYVEIFGKMERDLMAQLALPDRLPPDGVGVGIENAVDVQVKMNRIMRGAPHLLPPPKERLPYSVPQ